MSNKTICYIGGCGRLGLSMAAWSAHKGYSVWAADIDHHAVEMLNNRKCPISEPGVDELVREHSCLNLLATTDIPRAVKECSISFVVVPTPTVFEGGFSSSYVMEAMCSIRDGLLLRQGGSVPTRTPPYTAHHWIVIVSTMMPGETMRVAKQAFEDCPLEIGEDVSVVYSPEFIRQGAILEDFSNPKQILIGAESAFAYQGVAKYYHDVIDNEPPFHHMSIVSAEIAKLGLNAALSTKKAVADQLMWICHGYEGADVKDVIKCVGADSRIGDQFFDPGIWPGGPCLPRDNEALFIASKYGKIYGVEGIPANLALTTDLYRTDCAQALASLITSYTTSNAVVGLLGASYKPGVDILEGSPAAILAEYLVSNQRSVAVFDPGIKNRLDWAFNCDSLESIVSSAHVLVLVTRWPEFKRLEEINLEGRVVIDCWGFLNKEKMTTGTYVRLGKGQERKPW